MVLCRFTLKLDSWVSHAGIFAATIKFTKPLTVSWYDTPGHMVEIGSFSLDPLKVKSKRACINQTVAFTVTNETGFAQFTQTMITQQNFTWLLSSDGLDVQALKFPTAHGLKFNKNVTLNGMNNFAGNVSLVDFQLPRDDPSGRGIVFSATTGLFNPSAFNVDLGTVMFDLSYKGLYLGTGTGTETVVQPGANNITLAGTLIPQNGTTNLATVSELFTQYLNGETSDVIATGRSSVQSDGSTISWLSDGLTALNLHVPFKAPGAISPIKTISIGEMNLGFTPGTAWAPNTESRTVQASMELPFGFGVEIGRISNSFNITRGGAVVGGLSTVRAHLRNGASMG